jgi:hypothetical protein
MRKRRFATCQSSKSTALCSLVFCLFQSMPNIRSGISYYPGLLRSGFNFMLHVLAFVSCVSHHAVYFCYTTAYPSSLVLV